jgi:hypothetical protein
MKTAPLFIILLIGLGILGYVFLNKQNETNNLNTNDDFSFFEEENNTPVMPNNNTGTQTNTNTQTPPTNPAPTNPSVTTTPLNNPPIAGGEGSNCESINSSTALQLATSAGIYLEQDFGVSFVQAVDLTGDGSSECVFSGNGGNNGITFIVKNGVILRQKDKNNNINPVQLLTVGRVMFSEGYDFLPQNNGYYTISKSLADEISGEYICNENGLNAYIWNNATSLFEWNQSLTTSYTNSQC